MRAQLANLKFVLPVLGLALVPVVAFGFLIVATHDEQDKALAPEAAISAPVGTSLNEARRHVEITVVTKAAAQAVSAVSGTLTALSIGPGTPVVSGMVIGTVNDQPVLAYVADTPLYRDLVMGDRGSDVERLQGFLNASGYPVGQADGVFGPRTRDALRNLQRAAGLAVDGAVLRAQFVWIPISFDSIGRVEVNLGQQVDVGTALVSAPSAIESMKITAGDAAAESLSFPDDAELLFFAKDQSFPLPSITPSPESSADFFTFLQEQADAGNLAAESQDEKVTFRGGIVSDASAREVATVPAAALYANGAASCIFVIGDEGFQPLTIDEPNILPGTLDSLEVPITLQGSEVAINPLSLSHEVRATCASK